MSKVHLIHSQQLHTGLDRRMYADVQLSQNAFWRHESLSSIETKEIRQRKNKSQKSPSDGDSM